MKKSIGYFVLSLVFFITSLQLTFASTTTPGTVVAWGSNWAGQSTIPADLDNVVAISNGFANTVALKSDGTIVAWGYNYYNQSTVPAGLNNVIAIAAGNDHTLALRSDGTVVAWGGNYVGQSDVPVGLSDVVEIVAAASHSAALKSNGTMVMWGNNQFGQSSVPEGLSNVVAIATGPWHTMALKSDGTVVTWGMDAYGLLTPPAGLNNVVAIAAGMGFSLALKSDGTVVAWGRNYEGQVDVPTGLNNVVAVAAGMAHSVAVKSDGTVVAWGFNSDGQIVPPSDLKNVEAVSAGWWNTVAIVRGIPSDIIPPTLNVPDNFSVDATNPTGATVSYTVTATDNVSSNLSIICNPASGSIFSIGTTTVICVTTDEASNTTTKTFNITVLSPVQMIDNITKLVSQINASQGVVNSLDVKLQNAIASLNAVKVNSVATACNQLNAFINSTQAQSGKAITVNQTDQLMGAASQVITALGCH